MTLRLLSWKLWSILLHQTLVDTLHMISWLWTMPCENFQNILTTLWSSFDDTLKLYSTDHWSLIGQGNRHLLCFWGEWNTQTPNILRVDIFCEQAKCRHCYPTIKVGRASRWKSTDLYRLASSSSGSFWPTSPTFTLNKKKTDDNLALVSCEWLMFLYIAGFFFLFLIL